MRLPDGDFFSSNANADFEGLLDAKRGIRTPQAAEKTVAEKAAAEKAAVEKAAAEVPAQ